jgi:hypothetical protein
MWQVVHVVVFRLDIPERSINHTPSSLANGNLSLWIAITPKACLGIENRRMREVFPI